MRYLQHIWCLQRPPHPSIFPPRYEPIYDLTPSIVTEIVKVRSNLFQINGIAKQPLELPEPQGPVVTLSEKVYVPIKEHPDVST